MFFMVFPLKLNAKPISIHGITYETEYSERTLDLTTVLGARVYLKAADGNNNSPITGISPAVPCVQILNILSQGQYDWLFSNFFRLL